MKLSNDTEPLAYLDFRRASSTKTMHELIGIQTQGENPIGEQPAHFFKMLGETVPSGL